MTETRACPTCGAQVPGAAAFCTECGEQLPPAPSATDDPTRIDGPPLADPTAVAPTFTAPPTAAPWNPPAQPPTPTWQVPVSPPTAAPTGPPPAWAASPSTPPPPSWDPEASPSARARNAPSPLGAVLALIGAALTVAGVMSTWVAIDEGGTTEELTGWSLTTGAETLASNDPYLLLGLAACAVGAGVLLFTGAARNLVRIGAALVGVGIVGITALNWFAITDFVTDNLSFDVEVRTALGFYLAIAGGVVTALAALVPARS
ncbi:MAG: hypothetical protein KDA97_06885 [Acidimicrobiales bacterium]|nr:hypothetical protein [Acidimicrobiales bacterium]